MRKQVAVSGFCVQGRIAFATCMKAAVFGLWYELAMQKASHAILPAGQQE